MRCINTGRKCDGYNYAEKTGSKGGRFGTTSPSRQSAALPALPRFDDSRQKEFFGFFVSCTSSASSLYFGADFWSRRVLQFSLSEPSIRYALCSLSALHRMSTVSTLPRMAPTEFKRYALLQYNHAVKCTRDLLAESSDGSEDKVIKGLVACVLFVCYENFIGNYKIAQMHLQNGLQIIAKERLKQRPFAVPEDISQAFRRLDLQAMSFADSMAPYPYHLCNDPNFVPTNNSFVSIEGAMAQVLHIFRWIFRTAATWEPNPIPSEDLNSAYAALEHWDLEMESFLVFQNTKMTEELRRRIALLKMYQITSTILIATGVYGQEVLHDEHLPKYERVVALGEELLVHEENPGSTPNNQFFSFDIGVITPLFFTAIKCRDPQVRRRAIKLLASNHLQEGSWKSVGASKVAQFVMGIEEDGLGVGFGQHQVSETARVHLVKVATNVERCEIRLTCLLRSTIDSMSWYTREGQIFYGDDFSGT
jgi:cholestenol delta-isomerase